MADVNVKYFQVNLIQVSAPIHVQEKKSIMSVGCYLQI